MLPNADELSDNSIKPYVNYTFIAINALVFIFLQKFGTDASITNGYSTVPAEILTGKDFITQGQTLVDQYTNQSIYIQGLQPTLIPEWLTVFTSMFIHANFTQLAGNMLFLWIFGANIENRLGHLRYAGFYLSIGILAALSHVLSTFISDQNSLIPYLGASGAISGILGAYMVLFPQKNVQVFSFIPNLFVPAFIALGIWIVFQIMSGLAMLGGDENGGVTYAAHVGGFVAGILFVKIFDKRQVEMYIK